MSAEGNVLGGFFDLAIGTETVLNIPYDASSVDMKTKLEQATAITNVQVTRSNADVNGGHMWTVDFQG